MSEDSGRDGDARSRGLKERALTGFFWSYGAFAAGRLLVFVATVVLARLLAPEEFGLVAFALAILAYIENLSDLGVNETLVYRADAHDTRVASTAFWLGLAGAIVLTAAVWVAAPYVARVGPGDDVAWIIRILSLQLLLTSLGNAHQYLLRHALEFRRLFFPDFSSSVAKGAISIGLAAAGFGVWSLVYGQIAGTVVRTAGLWAVSRWRPVAQIDRDSVRSMVGFGLNLSGVALLGEAVRNLDYLFVGASLGATALGFYLLAFRLPELAVTSIFRVSYRVLFPFYARLKDLDESEQGRAELVRGYVRTVRLGSLIAFPAGFAMAALATPLVLIVYGDKWRESIGPLALIAIWTGFSAVNGMPGTIFKAIGRPGILTRLSLGYVLVLVPVLFVASRFGIVEVAAAQLGMQVAYLFVISVVMGRVLGVPWLLTPRHTLPALALSAAMAAAVYPLARLLPPAPALAAGLPAAALVYLLLVRLFLPGELEAVLVSGRRLLGRGGPRSDLAPAVEPVASPESSSAPGRIAP